MFNVISKNNDNKIKKLKKKKFSVFVSLLYLKNLEIKNKKKMELKIFRHNK